jgi:hypothetical protein
VELGSYGFLLMQKIQFLILSDLINTFHEEVKDKNLIHFGNGEY